MCPYKNTSLLQALRFILEATTGMDVVNAIFSKIEHGKIQLAKCKYMILLFEL